jgi:hypothetical protein
MNHSRYLPLIVLAASAVVAASACLPFRFGDPLHEVDIENSTRLSLRIYQDGVNRTLPLDLAPRAIGQTAFAWPIDSSDGRARMILAEDAAGKRVYCERFRYADLLKVNWKIKVIERDLCG